MKSVNRIAGAATMCLTLLIGCGLLAPRAQAAYTVTLMQQGNDVVATGSGTIDLAGLTNTGSFVAPDPGMSPLAGFIATGSPAGGPISHYSGVSGPTRFGNGFLTDATSGTGDFVGILGGVVLEVPVGFDSGSAVSDSAIYANQTFSMLGATPGSYTWTWGSGSDDSFTLQIGSAAAPEPSALALLALPLGLVMLLTARNPRATRIK